MSLSLTESLIWQKFDERSHIHQLLRGQLCTDPLDLSTKITQKDKAQSYPQEKSGHHHPIEQISTLLHFLCHASQLVVTEASNTLQHYPLLCENRF